MPGWDADAVPNRCQKNDQRKTATSQFIVRCRMTQFSPQFTQYLAEVEHLTEDKYRTKSREERLVIYESYRTDAGGAAGIE
jgi:hypothetical protein